MPAHDPNRIPRLADLSLGEAMNLLENAKAYVSLVALIATALMGSFATDSPVGRVLTGVVAVAGAFATWRVPNQPAA